IKQIAEANGPVEHGVLGVDMEMDKGGGHIFFSLFGGKTLILGMPHDVLHLLRLKPTTVFFRRTVDRYSITASSSLVNSNSPSHLFGPSLKEQHLFPYHFFFGQDLLPINPIKDTLSRRKRQETGITPSAEC
ncbi:hypothetical protein VU10_07985, partial [Desulfobulbus sp. US1]|nr:hypothetical protein [Desulfobulbus sp. US1]